MSYPFNKPINEPVRDYGPGSSEKQPLKQPLEKLFPEYPECAGMFNIPASSGANATES